MALPWDAGMFEDEREHEKEKIRDVYLSGMYIVFSFMSVSWVMLEEGAEVTGAHLNSSGSFYNNGNPQRGIGPSCPINRCDPQLV